MNPHSSQTNTAKTTNHFIATPVSRGQQPRFRSQVKAVRLPWPVETWTSACIRFPMLGPIIRNALRLLAAAGIAFASCGPAAASHLVTGNGHGFAVVAPESGAATKLYPHPYSYARPDPANPLSEGIETANFIKTLGWGKPGRAGTADYVEDSHVIRLRRADGSGVFFMPFGFERPALIVSFEAAQKNAAAWRVEWNRPLRSQRGVGPAGAELLRFEGI